MPTAHLATLTDTLSYIAVFPGWESDIHPAIRSEHVRLQDGSIVSYRLGTQWAMDIALTWVTSSQRSIIGAWWESNHEIVYVEALSSSPQSIVCRITNDEHPFPFRMQPDFNSHRGILYLRETHGTGQTSGAYIIADDPVFGLADTAPFVAF